MRTTTQQQHADEKNKSYSESYLLHLPRLLLPTRPRIACQQVVFLLIPEARAFFDYFLAQKRKTGVAGDVSTRSDVTTNTPALAKS